MFQDALSGATPQIRGSSKNAIAADVDAATPAARPSSSKRSAVTTSASEPAVPVKRGASTRTGASGAVAVPGSANRAGSVRAGEGAGVGAAAGARETAAPAAVATKPGTTRTVRRTTSRKAAAPPPKYPHLAKVEEMAWKTAEDVNRTNESGKLTVRSVRNAIGDFLESEVFWSTMVAAIKRRAKLANNKERADQMINACNALTSVLTGPLAARGLEKLAADVYDAAVTADPSTCTSALSLATEMVNGGQVTDGLKATNNIVNNVDISPGMVTNVFSKIIKVLNHGGAVVMSQGVSNGLFTVYSRMNRQGSRRV